MAKFLLATWPIAGHYQPNLAIANALRDRGHQVAFFTGARAVSTVVAEGFPCFPFESISEEWVDRVFFPPSNQRSHLRKVWDKRSRYRDLLVGTLHEQIRDLKAVLQTWKTDVVVCDPTMWGPFLVLREIGGVTVAIFVYVPFCLLPGPGVPPLGHGLPTPRTWAGRLRSSVVGAVTRVLTRDIRCRAQAVRRQYGLGRLETTVTEFSRRMPLYLVAGTPDFDYGRKDLGPPVHYVGPCLWNKPADQPVPDWLRELRADQPCVHVSEGTIHTQTPFVLQAAARGLADCPMQVVMATGAHRDPGSLGLTPLAPNIRVERWVPYQHLLPRTDVVVTTGGAGTVLAALMEGVPLVVIPTDWDKPEVAQRVVEAGAGVRLAPRRCTPRRLSEAVERVLSEASFRTNARRLAASFAKCDGPNRAAELLESLSAEVQHPEAALV